MPLPLVGKAGSVLCRLAILVMLSPLLLSARTLPESIQPVLPEWIAQAQDPRKVEADWLHKQGQEQFDTSQFDAAIRSWQQALELYREIKDRRGEGQTLRNLGRVHRLLGNYPKAIEYLEQSLAIAREIKDQQLEGLSLASLGVTHRLFGNYPKAIEYLEQSLAIAREIKDQQLEDLSLASLGVTHRLFGNYPKAIEYYEQSLAIARKVKDQRREGTALGDLGFAYLALRNYQKAIEYFEQSLATAKESKDRKEESRALSDLGNGYESLRNYPKAIEYYKQSLAIEREVKDRNQEALVLNWLGFPYRSLGNYAKAIEYYEQSLAIARETKNKQLEGATLNNLGTTRLQAGELFQAEQDLFAAIDVFESIEYGLRNTDQTYFLDTYRTRYTNLQEVLIAQKKIEAALEVAERGRARAFVNLLVQRTQGQDTPTLEPIQIEAIKQVARNQRATLVEYTNVVDENDEPFMKHWLFIWVVKPTGEVSFRQVDLKPLEDKKTSIDNLIAAARCLGTVGCEEAVASRGSQTIAFNEVQGDRQFGDAPVTTIRNEYLQQLHKLLIDPISDLLPTNPNERIIFIPQGRMFLLPFAALQDEQGKYLIEKHQIALAPSIQVLQLTQQQRQKRSAKAGNVVLVGNPTMPMVTYKPGELPKQLTSLPGAEKEVNFISKLLKVPALIGKQATETTVRELMPTARIIHLATHGLLDDLGNTGIPGAIALAADNKNDGLLTANELMGMKLQAELVVLSACDTGRGRITGDGVIGLSRSLMTAGVPSVVVSLWKVPDAATADLMTHFYRHLNQGKDKSAALRQAMLDTQKEFPDPVNWAAFVLMGESK